MINRPDYIEAVKPFIDKPLVKILAGVRRCGKSTIFEMLKEEFLRRGVSMDHIICKRYTEMDIPENITAKQMYDELTAAMLGKGHCYLLLDEIQEIDGWEKAVNSLLESTDADIYVTGSNSKLMSGEISTYLTGRYVSIPVYTLSFEEYLAFKQDSSLSRRELLEDYIRFGGFPLVALSEYDEQSAYQIVNGIYHTVVSRDIVKRHRINKQDLFDRVQEKLAKNKKAPARHKAEDDYLLTTKLFCGYCGAYLCGESGTSRTGKVHHYYKCVSVKKKRTECHKKPVRKEWIEDLVVGETMKMVMDDKAIEAIISMLMDLQDRDNVNVPLYEQQLHETETAISNLLGAIQQGILTRSTKARLEELESRRDELENRLACEKLAKPKVSAEFMTFWLHRFRKLDVRQQSHRKMLIDTFINAIFLYDDKMVITFNYKEGTKTITFAELQEAISNKNGSDLDCLAAPLRNDLWMSGSRAGRARLDSKGLSSFKIVAADAGPRFCF